ncbi:MAG: MurR/RpiR family transcriptional regulator [Bacteroidia bacterium]|nr:MurR/RpiR family transcriptional regulator [Bacteroidia bacterium]
MAKETREPALLLKMKRLYASLSKAEKLVIDQIILDPSKVIHLSVAGLAESCGTSEATVVRACRKLGLEGYQDLKVTLAQDIVTPLQSINEEIEPGDDANTIVDKIFQGTLHTLNFTHDNLKVSSIEQTADVIMNAKTTLIIGLGNSQSIALDMMHKLLRLGLNAVSICDTHIQTIRATSMTKDDCVFAISHSGSSRDIVTCAEVAKAQGATIISLTDIGTSPLNEIADIRLYTASKETKYRIVAIDSRIAQLTLIGCIYTIIATKKPGVVEGFRRIEQSLKSKKY